MSTNTGGGNNPNNERQKLIDLYRKRLRENHEWKT